MIKLLSYVWAATLMILVLPFLCIGIFLHFCGMILLHVAEKISDLCGFILNQIPDCYD